MLGRRQPDWRLRLGVEPEPHRCLICAARVASDELVVSTQARPWLLLHVRCFDNVIDDFADEIRDFWRTWRSRLATDEVLDAADDLALVGQMLFLRDNSRMEDDGPAREFLRAGRDLSTYAHSGEWPPSFRPPSPPRTRLTAKFLRVRRAGR